MSRNPQPQCRWLVCYDISHPRRRRRVALRLEGMGERLQRSVFIVESTPDHMTLIVSRCRAELEAGDSVQAYPLVGEVRSLVPSPARPGLPTHWVC